MKEVKRYWFETMLDADDDSSFGEHEFVHAQDYDSLLRKFAEVERDAARYRWLRERIAEGSDGNDGNWTALVELTDGYSNSEMYDDGEKLDAAIDSAMPGEG